MKKILFFLAVSLIGVTAMGQAQEGVNVYLLNGMVSSTTFDDFHKFVFSGDNLVIHRLSGDNTTVAMDDVQKIMFGSFKTSTDVENVRLAGVLVYQSGSVVVVSSEEAIRSVVLIDLSGRIIHNNSSIANVYEYGVSVNGLVKGVYLMTVETEHGATNQKVVIK